MGRPDLQSHARCALGAPTHLLRVLLLWLLGSEVHTNDLRITLLGPERLAKLIVETGLVSWLLNKVR